MCGPGRCDPVGGVSLWTTNGAYRTHLDTVCVDAQGLMPFRTAGTQDGGLLLFGDVPVRQGCRPSRCAIASAGRRDLARRSATRTR